MIAGMPILFLIVGKEEYFSAYNYIPILLIGMFFNIVVTFIGAIYIAKKKTKEVAITSLWAGILNVVINVSLIHFIGVWAAALSTLMSFLIMSVYRYKDVQKYVSLKLSVRAALLNLLIAIPAVALYYMHSIYMTVLNVLMVGAYVVLIWYKDIGRILRKKKAE
jgi:O-antigen/teichoic acid export membrane protein